MAEVYLVKVHFENLFLGVAFFKLARKEKFNQLSFKAPCPAGVDLLGKLLCDCRSPLPQLTACQVNNQGPDYS